MVGADEAAVTAVRGREFYKMTGSGNDFVFIDARGRPPAALERVEVVRSICARGTGVGADGIVFLEPAASGAFSIRYLNSDGSMAALCGNAALCATRLAADLGIVEGREFSFETEAGEIRARLRDGLPEIDLEPVMEVVEQADIRPEAGESRIGFALAGVPHLVVECADVSRIDVPARGAVLRRHPSLQSGANVNFVSPTADAGGWDVRTFERGVEAETLACGTGAVACAVLLSSWKSREPEIAFRTRSGRTLTVRLTRRQAGWYASLRGEGRLVFRGVLEEVA